MPIKAPQKGDFLISEPFLPDPNFKRTVILLTEHNHEGSVGFVLNKNMHLSIEDTLEGFPEFDVPVYNGGPVQPETLHFIHKLENLEGCLHVIGDIYWGGDFDALKVLIDLGKVNKNEILFFIGYSGWSAGQLDMEIKEKSWIVSPAKEEFIFSNNTETLWQDILKTMDQKYAIMANFPEDPSLN